ncbi:MAG: hypothetical protein ACD_78C00137G0001, partial [uncultured bacterium (gcode 4)]
MVCHKIGTVSPGKSISFPGIFRRIDFIFRSLRWCFLYKGLLNNNGLWRTYFYCSGKENLLTDNEVLFYGKFILFCDFIYRNVIFFSKPLYGIACSNHISKSCYGWNFNSVVRMKYNVLIKIIRPNNGVYAHIELRSDIPKRVSLLNRISKKLVGSAHIA